MDEIILVSCMPENGWLEEDSWTSIARAKDIAGLNRKRAIKLMDLARERGITSDQCRWSADRQFLERRTTEKKVALAFNGYCFIMERASMNCITIQKLPKYFGRKKTYYRERRSESRQYELSYAS